MFYKRNFSQRKFKYFVFRIIKNYTNSTIVVVLQIFIFNLIRTDTIYRLPLNCIEIQFGVQFGKILAIIHPAQKFNFI